MLTREKHVGCVQALAESRIACSSRGAFEAWTRLHPYPHNLQLNAEPLADGPAVLRPTLGCRLQTMVDMDRAYWR